MHIVKTKTAITIVCVSVLLMPTGALAQKKNGPGLQDRQQEQHSLAVNIVRAINTAEANFKQKHGTYATWESMFANGDFTDTGTKWASPSFPTVAHAMYGRGPEIVPGWKLRLTVSKDGNAYDLLLEDATDAKCRFAVGSDERGFIRQGRLIDCPV